MTDTPQEIADECFDIYLTEMGIRTKERRLIISYASKRVKEACKVKWFYISKGDLPEHGRQVRVLYENGYVGINNYASNEWVSDNHRTVVMWHELLEIIEPL